MMDRTSSFLVLLLAGVSVCRGAEFVVAMVRDAGNHYVVGGISADNGGWFETDSNPRQQLRANTYGDNTITPVVSGRKTKATRVSTSDDVTIHAWSRYSQFSPLPTSTLGSKYIVSACAYSLFHSSVLVVAAADIQTNITITFKKVLPLIGHNLHAGTLSTTLEPFEALTMTLPLDLTGTIVISSKRVAVFTGTKYNSYMVAYTQLVPVEKYGQEFLVAVDDYSQYKIQVVSEEREVTLTFNNGSSSTLDEHGLFRMSIARNGHLYFNSSKPVMTTLCRNSQKTSGLLVIPPLYAYTSGILPTVDNQLQKILVDDAGGDVTVSGVGRAGYQISWQTVPGTGYKVGTCRTQVTVTFVRSSFRFVVLSYVGQQMYSGGGNYSNDRSLVASTTTTTTATTSTTTTPRPPPPPHTSTTTTTTSTTTTTTTTTITPTTTPTTATTTTATTTTTPASTTTTPTTATTTTATTTTTSTTTTTTTSTSTTTTTTTETTTTTPTTSTMTTTSTTNIPATTSSTVLTTTTITTTGTHIAPSSTALGSTTSTTITTSLPTTPRRSRTTTKVLQNINLMSPETTSDRMLTSPAQPVALLDDPTAALQGEDSPDTALIASGASGGLLLLLILIVTGAACYVKRRRLSHRKSSERSFSTSHLHPQTHENPTFNHCSPSLAYENPTYNHLHQPRGQNLTHIHNHARLHPPREDEDPAYNHVRLHPPREDENPAYNPTRLLHVPWNPQENSMNNHAFLKHGQGDPTYATLTTVPNYLDQLPEYSTLECDSYISLPLPKHGSEVISTGSVTGSELSRSGREHSRS